jgi:uncharacterized metal-binding protein
MNCTDCPHKDCYQGKDCTPVHDASLATCRDPEVARVMKVAAAIESDGYGELDRLHELARYAHDMGHARLGLAFCVGLADEARLIHAFLQTQDLRVYSACCKLCGLPKDDLGLARLHPDWPTEATCNPVGQALELQRCRTELNVAIGLCIGHDILFAQHSHAPVTTLVVKDRVHAHSPLTPLYTRYGRSKLGL